MAAEIIPVFDQGDYDEHIRRAAARLTDGGIVILPTETVYGAGVVLSDAKAVERLRSLPPAARGKPMVVHIANASEAKRYTGELSEFAQRMIRKLWPGPVGLIFDVSPDRQRQVASHLGVDASELYENDTITLRCPHHIVATDLLATVGSAVVVRKAGSGDALTAQSVSGEWGGLVDTILDAGPTAYSKPSTLVKVGTDSYQIVRAGVFDQRIIEQRMRTTVLFVCSGNTCRSPMAEAIARKLLAEKLGVAEGELERKGVTVLSAGSFAMPGARATPAGVEAVRAIGGDLSKHRSRPLTVELIHQADVIYTMARSHQQAVTALVPAAADKVSTLDPAGDIEDPIGGDISLYQALAARFVELIERRLAERTYP